MKRVNGCSFCNLSERESILKTTNNFYIIPSIGSIIDGYILLNTKNHIPSYSNLDYQLLDEFLKLKEEIRNILEQAYSRGCIFYEHGLAGSSIKLKFTDEISYHSHLHCIATNVNLLERISKDFSPIRIKAWIELLELGKNNQHYLFYEDNNRNMGTIY